MDLIRQTGVFDPTPYHDNVAIVGVGALGSALALQLAKAGISDLHLFDSDIVAPHNLPNQCLYGPADVGTQKVAAAVARLQALTGNPHHAWPKVETGLPRSRRNRLRYPVVFACVDSMDVRRRLYDEHVYSNGATRVYGEARMGVRHGVAYLIDPASGEHRERYLQELYPDEDVVSERAACGATLSIGATAMTLACVLTWMLIAQSRGQLTQNEILVKHAPWGLTGYSLGPWAGQAAESVS